MKDTRGRTAEQFLTEAARSLTLSLDYEATIANLAQLAVPTFADWCFVDLFSDDGEVFDRVAVGHHRTGSEAIAKTLKRRYPLRMLEPVGVARAVHELKPQLLRDLGDEFAERVARDPEHLLAIRALEMRSAVVAPMLVRGKPIGALSLISSGRNFDEQDLWFITQLANHAAVAIDNARLFESERRARERVTKLQEVTAGFSRASTPGEVAEVACRIGTEATEANSGALWLGRTDGSLVLAGSWGTPAEFIKPYQVIDADAKDVPALRVLCTGEPIWVETAEDYRRVSPVVFDSAQAAGRLAAFGAVPIAVNGVVGGVMVFSHALGHRYSAADRAYYDAIAQHCSQALDRARLLETERQLLESERRSNTRLRLLAQAGEALTHTPDLDDALRSIAKLIVPALADWCVVDLLDGQVIRRVATENQDPEKVKKAWELARQKPVRVGDDAAMARVIAEGKAHFYPRLPAAVLERAARDAAELERLRNENLMSAIVVPLAARGACIGVLSLTTSDSGRVYDESDLAFAEELGRRIGVALSNARMRLELEEAHERMRLLFMMAPMSIAIYRGPEHRIEFANPTFLQVRSRGPEIIGKTHAEVFPEAIGAARDALDLAFSSSEQQTFPEIQTRLDRGRGPEDAYFHAAFVGLKDDQGHVDRVMSVSFEVDSASFATVILYLPTGSSSYML